MILHAELGKNREERSRALYVLIKSGQVTIDGNRKLKIYGALDCSSGKRMKVENRVFFASIEEAIKAGYRPCGHCMHDDYIDWRKQDEGER